jgi:hypothetical protein
VSDYYGEYKAKNTRAELKAKVRESDLTWERGLESAGGRPLASRVAWQTKVDDSDSGTD